MSDLAEFQIWWEVIGKPMYDGDSGLCALRAWQHQQATINEHDIWVEYAQGIIDDQKATITELTAALRLVWDCGSLDEAQDIALEALKEKTDE